MYYPFESSSVADSTPQQRARVRDMQIKADPIIAGGRAKNRARVIAKVA